MVKTDFWLGQMVRTSQRKQFIIVTIITLFYVDLIVMRPQRAMGRIGFPRKTKGCYKRQSKFVDIP